MRTRILPCFIAFLLLAPMAMSADPHYTKAVELRSAAMNAYDSGDYDRATDLARQAKAELALVAARPRASPVEQSAPAPAAIVPEASVAAETPEVARPPLPASYTVRLILEERDSLSKIAGYPFVYNDPSKWTVLYLANKKSLRHPENADIILPGEVILIPSLGEESREGAWQEGLDYPSLE
jgi:nucleoid-associated protein YgaU